MVTINGESVDADAKTVTAYLAGHGYDVARVAIELNGVILPKVAYGETVMKTDDVVEIVAFVRGG